MDVVAGVYPKINALIVIIVLNAPDSELLLQCVPIEAKKPSSLICLDRLEHACCLGLRWCKLFKISRSTLVVGQDALIRHAIFLAPEAHNVFDVALILFELLVQEAFYTKCKSDTLLLKVDYF